MCSPPKVASSEEKPRLFSNRSTRHRDVPAAEGGELRVKTTLFDRSTRREWQDARVANSNREALIERSDDRLLY